MHRDVTLHKTEIFTQFWIEFWLLYFTTYQITGSKALTVTYCSQTGNMVSNPTLGVNVCLNSLCLVSCAVTDLATGGFRVSTFYHMSIRNTKMPDNVGIHILEKCVRVTTGKTMCITYSERERERERERVCVVLVTQLAMGMRRVILSCVACLVVPYISTLHFKKRQNSEVKG